MWDKRYASDDYLFGTQPAAALRAHAHCFPQAASCLCVADGEGRNSVWLAQQGHQVTAWDSSAVALAKAQQLSKARGVEITLSQQSAESFDWDGAQYDVVIGVFIQFADPLLRAAMFDGMKRATCPGGLVFLHGYTPGQIAHGTGGPSAVENLYTTDLLETSFADFEIMHLESYEAEIHEGTGHVGRSALIDLIARRPGD